jgi:hypothetical protein
MPRARLAWSIACLLACAMSSAARADAGKRVAVVPWVNASDSNTAEQVSTTTAEVAQVLTARGFEVVDPTLIRMRLLAYGRFPVSPLSDAERAEFQALSRKAWIAVGRQDLVEAKRAISSAMGYAKAHLEALNRTDSLAQALLDLCLLTPRVMINQGASRQLVVLEALECRKLVPRVSPSENDHLPEVLLAVQEADKIMRTVPPATLVVSGAAANGCNLFLNGRRFGRVPYRDAIVPGAYLLQVECPEQFDATGYVHEISLSSGKTTTVDVAPFEIFVRASPQGVYVTKEIDGPQRAAAPEPMASLVSFASRLDVDHVVVVHNPSPSVSMLEWVDGTSGVLACGAGEDTLPASSNVDALLECRARLAAIRPQDEESSERPSAPAKSYASSRTHSQQVWGVALAGTGLALLAAGWIGDGVTVSRDRGSSDFIYQGLGAAGAATLVVSEPYWLPVGKQHAPWWAWTGMALGIAPAIVSGVLWAKDDSCDLHFTTGGCATFNNTRTRAGLSLATSIPLLTLPASFYLARRVWGTEAKVSVSSSVNLRTGSVDVSLRGMF